MIVVVHKRTLIKIIATKDAYKARGVAVRRERTLNSDILFGYCENTMELMILYITGSFQHPEQMTTEHIQEMLVFPFRRVKYSPFRGRASGHVHICNVHPS